MKTQPKYPKLPRINNKFTALIYALADLGCMIHNKYDYLYTKESEPLRITIGISPNPVLILETYEDGYGLVKFNDGIDRAFAKFSLPEINGAMAKYGFGLYRFPVWYAGDVRRINESYFASLTATRNMLFQIRKNTNNPLGEYVKKSKHLNNNPFFQQLLTEDYFDVFETLVNEAIEYNRDTEDPNGYYQELSRKFLSEFLPLFVVAKAKQSH